MNVDTLKRMRDFVVRQKVRVDFAMSLLTILNLALLIVAASDKLNRVFHFDEQYYTYYLIMFVVPGAIICVWFVGFLLDKYVRYQQTVTDALNSRNPQIMQILDEIKKINERLDKMEVKK